jgi:hypothetical protein
MSRDLQGPVKIEACMMKEYLAGTRRNAGFLDWQAVSQAFLNASESSVTPFPAAPKDSTLKTRVFLGPVLISEILGTIVCVLWTWEIFPEQNGRRKLK